MGLGPLGISAGPQAEIKKKKCHVQGNGSDQAENMTWVSHATQIFI
jgi:hypothetical protein